MYKQFLNLFLLSIIAIMCIVGHHNFQNRDEDLVMCLHWYFFIIFFFALKPYYERNEFIIQFSSNSSHLTMGSIWIRVTMQLENTSQQKDANRSKLVEG